MGHSSWMMAHAVIRDKSGESPPQNHLQLWSCQCRWLELNPSHTLVPAQPQSLPSFLSLPCVPTAELSSVPNFWSPMPYLCLQDFLCPWKLSFHPTCLKEIPVWHVSSVSWRGLSWDDVSNRCFCSLCLYMESWLGPSHAQGHT